MVISSINCNYRTYKYTYVTRGPLLVSLQRLAHTALVGALPKTQLEPGQQPQNMTLLAKGAYGALHTN